MVPDETGDPRVTVLARLHGAEAIPDEGLLDWLGGERVVLDAASAWQADVGAVVVAEALTQAWESLADPDRAAHALLAAVTGLVPPGGFGDLLDALVDAPNLLARVGRDLFEVVLGLATNDATSRCEPAWRLRLQRGWPLAATATVIGFSPSSRNHCSRSRSSCSRQFGCLALSPNSGRG